MGFTQKLLRKKVVEEAESSDLNRILGTFGLTTLGVGSTLGTGVYVLTGSVSKTVAGPAIIISFAVAGLCSLLAGFCYAELGARVPKAGSAYIYSYVTVGEIWGFVIGWNLILEYIIGVSSVARGFTANLDALVDGKISKFMTSAIPMHITGLAPYPDFIAVAIILLVTILLVCGMSTSAKLMSIFTVLNIVVLLVTSVSGFIKADPHNWSLNQTEVFEVCNSSDIGEVGVGGFLPFGFSNMMQGAATCFFAFVGFDVIACLGEEAKNPSKSIPRSIMLTLLICFVAYALVSSVLTLMEPYCLMDVNAPIPAAFKYVGFSWAAIPLALGSMVALLASLLGGAVGMPRIVFSMARDGLIFKYFANVNSSGTPVRATVASGIFSSLLAMIFDLEALVNMMSIGTLMAYTLVAASVLKLRYSPTKADSLSINEIDTSSEHEFKAVAAMERLKRKYELNSPCNNRTSSRVNLYTIFIVILMVVLCCLLVFCKECVRVWWGYTLISLLMTFIVGAILIINIHPESKQQLNFKTPLVPWVPFISMFVNLYLMLKLPTGTWIRFAVWMVIGFAVYFFYGIKNSVEGLSGINNPNIDYENFENEDIQSRQSINNKTNSYGSITDSQS